MSRNQGQTPRDGDKRANRSLAAHASRTLSSSSNIKSVVMFEQFSTAC